MTASPRQLARSTRLWVLSALAWLMLVVQAVPAMPMPVATAALTTHADMANMPDMGTAMHGDHAHSGDHAGGEVATPAPAADHDNCCGDTTTAHCSCAAMCASALLPLPSLTVAANPALAGVADQSDRSTPQRPLLPPLRPPQA